LNEGSSGLLPVPQLRSGDLAEPIPVVLPAPADGDVHRAAPSPGTFRRTLNGHWQSLLLNYALYNLENIVGLAQPLVLALAINDLIGRSYFGLYVFVGQFLGHTLLGSLRIWYDGRVFTSIYSSLAARLVLDQRRGGIAVSEVAARSALAHEVVDFLDREIPMVIHTGYAVGGALLVLALTHPDLLYYSMAILPLVVLLNWIYGRRARVLNQGLNDELEREVEVVAGHNGPQVRRHYHSLADFRIRLANLLSGNYAITNILALCLMITVLLGSTLRNETSPGEMVSLICYVLIFVDGLHSVPLVVRQAGRFSDIVRRMR
jgi:hypothetical protein